MQRSAYISRNKNGPTVEGSFMERQHKFQVHKEAKIKMESARKLTKENEGCTWKPKIN